MSIQIQEVVDTLKKLKIPAATIVAVENELEQVLADKQEAKADAGPKVKSTFVTILLDPNHQVQEGAELTSLVIQIPEEQDAGETLTRLHQAVYDQRAAAKRKPRLITSVGDAADGLKRRFAKERGLLIKTKIPARVIISDNSIPNG